MICNTWLSQCLENTKYSARTRYNGEIWHSLFDTFLNAIIHHSLEKQFSRQRNSSHFATQCKLDHMCFLILSKECLASMFSGFTFTPSSQSGIRDCKVLGGSPDCHFSFLYSQHCVIQIVFTTHPCAKVGKKSRRKFKSRKFKNRIYGLLCCEQRSVTLVRIAASPLNLCPVRFASVRWRQSLLATGSLWWKNAAIWWFTLM